MDGQLVLVSHSNWRDWDTEDFLKCSNGHDFQLGCRVGF